MFYDLIDFSESEHQTGEKESHKNFFFGFLLSHILDVFSGNGNAE